MSNVTNAKTKSDLTTAGGASLVLIALAENFPYPEEYVWLRSVFLALAPVISGFFAYVVGEYIKRNHHLSDDQKKMLTVLKEQQKHIKQTLKNKDLDKAIRDDWKKKLSDNLDAIHEVYQLSMTTLETQPIKA